MLFVKSAGVSTANIVDTDNMIDVLIEKKIYSLRKNSKDRNAVQSVLEEATATHLPAFVAGGEMEGATSVQSVSEAIEQICQESVIVGLQKGEDGNQDAAAIVVTPFKPVEALAVIESIEEDVTGSQARILELYKEKGAVADVLSILEASLSKNFAFDFKQDWDGEFFLDASYDTDTKLYCQLSNSVLAIRQAKETEMPKKRREQFLVPIGFETEVQLQKRYNQLCTAHTNIQELSRESIELYANRSEVGQVVVFLVRDKEELADEMKLFFEQKEKWFQKSFQWKSARGSVYYADSLGKDKKVCFVNPPGGMFSKIPFYKLYRAIPILREHVKKNRITKKSKSELITRYYFEIMTIMLTVKALEHVGIEQDAVVGGSLGELSVPLIMDVTSVQEKDMKAEDCSLDIMHEVILMLEEIVESQSQLSQEYFGEQIGEMEKWYLICDSKVLQEEMKKFPKNAPIFRIIIGSPKDTIICGTHQLCMELINRLKCYNLQLKDPIYAHTPVLEPQHIKMKKRVEELGIHLKENLPFDIYGTYRKKKLGTTIEEFAENYADCLIKQVNMPDIFEQAYQDGNRVFIDLGSSMFCSRWLKESFQDKEDVYVFSLYDKSNPIDNILSIVKELMANNMHLHYNKYLEWYLGTMKIEKREDGSMRENELWKKNFMEELVKKQMVRNNQLFQCYLKSEKKIANEVLKGREEPLYSQEEETVCCKPEKKEPECLYNYEQILEMTDGSMEKVLGSTYREVDQYAVRARMPLPPYLFASRITKIHAKYGEIKEGSYIEAEYDVPDDCIMKVNKKSVSSVVFSEAAHIGIFLAGYMGIDTYSSGKSKFRITDVSTKYVSEKWPVVGDTIQMKFVIDRLIKNGDITLLICSYKVFMDGELIIDAKETGGFFTQQALDSGAGIQGNKLNGLKMQKKAEETGCTLYQPVTKQQAFNKTAVSDFLSGDYIKCFGKDIVNSQTPYQVCKDAMFIDEILEISQDSGKYGLGYIIAKKEVDSSYWPFQCHFKNDPVLPGTIMLEGLSQAVTFFQTYMGIYNTEKPFVTTLMTGNEIQTKFRGEVKCASHTILYRVDPKVVKKTDQGILFVADGEVYCDELQVIEQKNASMIIKEIS